VLSKIPTTQAPGEFGGFFILMLLNRPLEIFTRDSKSLEELHAPIE
jgi:hypothetical protein